MQDSCNFLINFFRQHTFFCRNIKYRAVGEIIMSIRFKFPDSSKKRKHLIKKNIITVFDTD